MVNLRGVVIRRDEGRPAALGINIDASANLIIIGVLPTPVAIVSIAVRALRFGTVYLGRRWSLKAAKVLNRILSNHDCFLSPLRQHRMLTLIIRYQVGMG
jgi:hypothetical protein